MAKCVCKISKANNSYEVSGFLVLEQATESSPTTIKGELSGLLPGKHGLSIMVFGDLRNPPASLGEHFNPHGKKHGAPSSDERHTGSLGNIEADADGVARVNISDNEVKLIGPLSVCGRSVAVHLNEDDLGLGGSEYSLINGNAGPVIGCGVVGISIA